MADGHRREFEKNEKTAIFQHWFDRSQEMAWRRNLRRLSVLTVEILKIYESKMAAAAILKNRKIPISQQRFDRSPRSEVK